MANELTLKDKIDYVKTISSSTLLPDAFKNNPSNLMMQLEYGQALGLPLTVALQGIYVVEGKPSVGANLMMGLIEKSGKGHIDVEHEDTRKVVLRGTRYAVPDRNIPERVMRVQFTWEDAERANLTRRNNWKSYPQDMLFSKALGRLGRRMFGDILMGAYIEGEIDNQKLHDPKYQDVPVPEQKTEQGIAKESKPKSKVESAIEADYEEVTEEKSYEPFYPTHDSCAEYIAKLKGFDVIQKQAAQSKALKQKGVDLSKEPHLGPIFQANAKRLRGQVLNDDELRLLDMEVIEDEVIEDDLPY